MDILIKNGIIVTAERSYEADLFISNGKIKEIEKSLIKYHDEVEVIDANGLFLLPGGIDPHVHMHLPSPAGFSADDFYTGSNAALFGGTTTLIDFVTPQKGQQLIDALKQRKEEAQSSLIDYSFHISPVEWRDSLPEEIEACMKEGITSFKVYMAYLDTIGLADDDLLKVMKAVGAAGEDVPPSACMELLSEIIGDDETLKELVEKAAVSAELGEDARAFCKQLGLEKGVTGYIYHTLPVVLQIWLRHPRDYEKAISEAVACGGDTDTVAAILGGIVGAAVGRKGIPEVWQSRLMEWTRSLPWLQELAKDLAAARLHGRGREAPDVSPVSVLFRNAFFMFWVVAHGFRRLLPPY